MTSTQQAPPPRSAGGPSTGASGVTSAQQDTSGGMVAALADATPAHRDRVVDLLRVFSIAIVVIWHWSLSITHWRDGSLTMPNPVGDVPGLWSATWVLQVMPLFFLVGGYANLAGWRSVQRDTADQQRSSMVRGFWSRRFTRLARPVATYVAVWATFDVAWQFGGGVSVLSWGMVVFVPLWFLGVYAAVVLLVPWTARWHDAHPVLTLLMLGSGTLAADLVRFGFGIAEAGLVGSACVWLLAHQLGYVWFTWSADANATAEPRKVGCARQRLQARGALLTAAALATLGLLTTFGPYPRSMVAVRGEEVSNMFPTTAAVAVLAVLQFGLVLLLRGHLQRWTGHRAVWKATVATNAVAMTVFCWHMTALVAFLTMYEAAGFTLSNAPTAGWWLSRPVWLLGPAVVLAGLVAAFARVELPRKSRRHRVGVSVSEENSPKL